MGKDPAFLFYYSDFLIGTEFMTNEETGMYIKILCFLADRKYLKEEHMKKICGTDKIPDEILSKLQFIEGKGYTNKRLMEEVEKRKQYAESRRQNRLSQSKTEEKPKDNAAKNAKELKKVEKQVELWNFFAENYKLDKLVKLTDARISHVKARMREKDFNLEHILRHVEKSDFLLGKKTDWKINFDFIFGSKNNWVKIMEGQYNGRNKQSIREDELQQILNDIANDPDLE